MSICISLRRIFMSAVRKLPLMMNSSSYADPLQKLIQKHGIVNGINPLPKDGRAGDLGKILYLELSF
jgi:hypothetical protein